MKKAGLITIAIVLLALGAFLYYRLQGANEKMLPDKSKGTLVKEFIEWKRYYI